VEAAVAVTSAEIGGGAAATEWETVALTVVGIGPRPRPVRPSGY
jgi:hypothetical protein